MSGRFRIAITAIAALGVVGGIGAAKALPLASVAPSQAHPGQSPIVAIKYHKAKHHRNRPRVTFGVTVPGIGYSGFHQGSYYHPHVYIDVGAPYHCHKWTDQFGQRQKICHRHW